MAEEEEEDNEILQKEVEPIELLFILKKIKDENSIDFFKLFQIFPDLTVHLLSKAKQIEVYHYDREDKLHPDEPLYMGLIQEKRSVCIMLSLFHYVEKKKKNFILIDPTDPAATNDI